jgi:hypothetical protein
MLGPSLLNNQGSISDRDIVLRGGNSDQAGIEQGLTDYLQAQVIQTGASITNGAILAGQEPFTVTFRAPFAGTANLNEVINGEDGPIIESQQVTVANFITFNPLADAYEKSESEKVPLMSRL